MVEERNSTEEQGQKDMSVEGKTKNEDEGRLTPEELRKRHLWLQKLRDTGEFERIQSKLYADLLLDKTWASSMEQKVRDLVRQSGGISEITLDELVSNLVVHGGSSQIVPDSIHDNICEQIRTFGSSGFIEKSD